MRNEEKEQARIDMQAESAHGVAFDKTTRLFGSGKEEFIASFMAEKRIDAYPVDEEELRVGPFGYWVTDDRVEVQLERQLGLLYGRLANGRSLPTPRALAVDLLGSMDGSEFCLLVQLPLKRLSIERILAHVESLGLKLPADISVAVARLAMMVLLDHATKREAGPSYVPAEVAVECVACRGSGKVEVGAVESTCPCCAGVGRHVLRPGKLAQKAHRPACVPEGKFAGWGES